jgi:phosphoribosyl-ATP pyrophosphohydrolase/phosphoribosyl-AMP cyclohydrolase
MLIAEIQQAEALDWGKTGGLLPATVQDVFDGRVLMQAWMNADALVCTLESGRVTFWSRSRQELWTKGETSGHFLALDSIHADCDRDSLLVPTLRPDRHPGTDSCRRCGIRHARPAPGQLEPWWATAAGTTDGIHHEIVRRTCADGPR